MRCSGAWRESGALANALRSLAYFDGARLAKPLIALTGLAVAGILLEALAERHVTRTQAAGEARTTLSAARGGPTD